jgi:hypothetical protein
MKYIFVLLFTSLYTLGSGQYIGVTAKYTETRLVDNSPELPTRENHLILSFYEVSLTGIYTPANLSNFDIWIYKTGLQYGSMMGGVFDSSGNNYPGYNFTAPQAVAYFNSMGPNYIDCNGGIATHYVVNGSTLDCGFIPVSSWESGNESFTAPNICLPYYTAGAPYPNFPGNLNFTWPMSPGPPYNWYSFSCGGSQQLVVRGVLPQDAGVTIVFLPVKFFKENVEMATGGLATISWSNLTEANLVNYLVEKSPDGITYQTIGTVIPIRNNGTSADYSFQTLQEEDKAFYRIKATENSGNIYYSTILFLNKPGPDAPGSMPDPVLSVYPNPANGSNFMFRLAYADTGRYLFCIITPDGRQIKQKMIEHNMIGELTRQIDLPKLPKGLYRAVLRSEKKRYSQSFFYGL